MDIESLKPLLSLLIWGGLFFLMMRFGCGAHMMGGHGHGNHGGHGDTAGEIKDPVCGMSIDPQKAKAASPYRGRMFYFCSNSCRDKFEQSPDKYAGAAAQSPAGHGAHDHG